MLWVSRVKASRFATPGVTHAYGPTMNAVETAEEAGRADDLARELDALFAT